MKFLTQISYFVLFLIFIYAINFKTFITLNHFINQAEIIELFCINRLKPELNCAGKCHLTSQLLEVKKEDTPFSQNNFSFNLEIISMFLKNKKSIQEKFHLISKQSIFKFKPPTSSGYISNSSPPPRV